MASSDSIPVARGAIGRLVHPEPVSCLPIRMPFPGGEWVAIARTWASAADMRRCRLCEAGCTGDLEKRHCVVATRRPVPVGGAKYFVLPDPGRAGREGVAVGLGAGLRLVGVDAPDGGQGPDHA